MNKEKVTLRKVSDGEHTRVFKVPTSKPNSPSLASLQKPVTPQGQTKFSIPQSQYLVDHIPTEAKRKAPVINPYTTEEFNIVSNNPAYRDPSMTSQFGVPNVPQVVKFVETPKPVTGQPVQFVPEETMENKIIDKSKGYKKHGDITRKLISNKKLWKISLLVIMGVLIITFGILAAVMFAS